MRPLVTIVITNYNYAAYLREAVDSALGQRYAPVQVVVVDDGSTDGSRQVLEEYGSRVVPVLKANGGQASAFNAGFARATGDPVLFLDADDVLLPDALERAVPLLADEGVVKVQWPLHVTDARGRRTGERRPGGRLSDGDLRAVVLEGGPTSIVSPPTSGNLWRRAFLEAVLPVPEDAAYYRVCADEYLYTLAPVLGRVATVPDPLGLYRIHGRNVYSGRGFREKVQLELDGHAEQCIALARVLTRLGFEPHPERWKESYWFARLDRALGVIASTVPAGSRVIVVDDQTWDAGAALEGYEVIPFLERDGAYFGAAGDEATAIAELTRLRDQRAARYVVVGWPAFWWLDEYPGFRRALERTGRAVRTRDVLIFELGDAA